MTGQGWDRLAGDLSLPTPRRHYASCTIIARTVWPEIDILVVPTAGTAYTIAGLEQDPVVRTNHNRYHSCFTHLLDLCAVAVANGFLPGSGVAMGVTVIAPAWHDDALAAFSLSPRACGGDGRGEGARLAPRASAGAVRPLTRFASRTDLSRRAGGVALGQPGPANGSMG